MEAGSIIMLIIWIAISIASSASKKKKREQNKQAASGAAQTEASAARPTWTPRAQTQRVQTRSNQTPRTQRSAPTPTRDDRFPELDDAPAPKDERFPELFVPKKKPAPTVPALEAEGTALGGSLAGTETERSALYAQIDTQVGKDPIHTVKAITESTHAHVESSIDGVQGQCPVDAPIAPDAPDYAQAYAITVQTPRARHFALDRESVVQGFLFGEILGKPKALRR